MYYFQQKHLYVELGVGAGVGVGVGVDSFSTYIHTLYQQLQEKLSLAVQNGRNQLWIMQ